MPRPPKSILVPALCAGTFLGLAGGYARAAEPAPTPPPANWWDTLTVTGAIEAGVTLNGDNPTDGLNFGHLFTDRANEPLINQTLLTVMRPLDPKATDYDFGFKAQVMYGSDARYIHYLGELDYIINDRNQIAVLEAWGAVHLPWLYTGGIDVKFGQYATLLGAEVNVASDNYLYSHSYIFNFGIPLEHTGILTISHIDPTIDIYAGVDTGVNTTIGYRLGDNNGAAAFLGGIGLNLFDGSLTVLASTHIGPENPDTNGTNNTIDIITACRCNPNSPLRYLNDIVERHDALRWPERPWRPGLPWIRGRHQELAIYLRRRPHREILEHVLKKLLAFFDSGMLQLFEIELRPYRSNGST